MKFEDFAADDPSQIVLGLFNGNLQAVYLFRQIGPKTFEAHFTSSRKAKREDVLAGARTLVQWFAEQGLVIVGYVNAGNGPLRHFLEEAGLTLETATSQTVSNSFYRYDNLPKA